MKGEFLRVNFDDLYPYILQKFTALLSLFKGIYLINGKIIFILLPEYKYYNEYRIYPKYLEDRPEQTV